jgi:hypothetical protein
VSKAARVGEQSAVVWKRVYLSPFLASLSRLGVGICPPKVPHWAEAAVVDQDEEDIRRAGRGFDDRDLRGLGILVSPPDDAVERGVWRRQDRG